MKNILTRTFSSILALLMIVSLMPTSLLTDLGIATEAEAAVNNWAANYNYSNLISYYANRHGDDGYTMTDYYINGVHEQGNVHSSASRYTLSDLSSAGMDINAPANEYDEPLWYVDQNGVYVDAFCMDPAMEYGGAGGSGSESFPGKQIAIATQYYSTHPTSTNGLAVACYVAECCGATNVWATNGITSSSIASYVSSQISNGWDTISKSALIAEYGKVPSFSGSTATLQYNADKKLFELTLEDTNATLTASAWNMDENGVTMTVLDSSHLYITADTAHALDLYNNPYKKSVTVSGTIAASLIPDNYQGNWLISYSGNNGTKQRLVRYEKVLKDISYTANASLSVTVDSAQIELTKTATDGKADGATFTVFEGNISASSGSTISDATVFEDNVHTANGSTIIACPPGEYTIYEKYDPAYMGKLDYGTITINGTEYVNNRWYGGDLTPGEAYQAAYVNTVKRVDISGAKVDPETSLTAPEAQGQASLKGAEYSLYTTDGTLVATQTADGNDGSFTFEDVPLSSSYYVQESKAPEGYQLSTVKYYVNIDVENAGEFNAYTITENDSANKVYEYVQRNTITVSKYDSVLSGSDQGDAKRNGLEFEIVSDNSQPVVVNGVTYNKGDVVETLTISGDASAATSSALPYGTYTVTETSTGSSVGYVIGAEVIADDNVRKTSVVKGSNDAYTVYDDVERGSIQVYKKDYKLSGTPEGDTTLAGAKFQIINASGSPITLNADQRIDTDTTVYATPDLTTAGYSKTVGEGDDAATYTVLSSYVYNPGSVICTVTSLDDTGACDIIPNLPYGTYTIHETAAPKGYLMDAEDATVELHEGLDGDPLTVEMADTPKSTSIEINKKDYQTYDVAQGDGKLDNMTFEIINDSTYPIYYKGSEIAPGEVVEELKTDNTGYAKSGDLPYGTYDIREKVAPYGYDVSEHETDFSGPNHDGSGNVKDDTLLEVMDYIKRGDLKVIKLDAQTEDINQGDATFVGTTFEIYNASKHPVYLSTADKTTDSHVTYAAGTYYSAKDGTSGSLYDPDELIATVVTDAQSGTVYATLPNMPFGTYHVVETVPPTGYLINGQEEYDCEVKNYDDNLKLPDCYETTEARCEDTVKRGRLTLVKKDDYSDTTAQGAATFAGAVFEVINASQQTVYMSDENHGTATANTLNADGSAKTVFSAVDGTTGYLYEPGEVIETIITDESGYAETGMLPYGTYTIKEVTAPEGYLNGTGDGQDGSGVEYTVSNYSSEGSKDIYDTADLEDLTGEPVQDSAKRSDFTFQKKNQTQSNLAGVVFRITSNTTGETHYIITDANGEYNSESKKVKHSVNTNANDGISVITNENGELEVEDESELFTGETGTWFAGIADSDLEPVDGRGAFPFDTYTVTELRSSANTGLTLLEFQLTIGNAGYTVDFGSLADLNPPVIQSVFTDADTGKNYATARTNAALSETLTLHSLTRGTEYTVTCTIVNTQTGETAVDADGNELVAGKTFTAAAEEMNNVVIEFTGVNITNLAGTQLTATDVLTYTTGSKTTTVKAAAHDLTTMIGDELEAQTILVPSIRTTLTDDAGNKEVEALKDVTLVDAVEYKSLDTTKTYRLTGTLMDKKTGREIKDANGDTYTSEVVFTPQTPDGSVQVIFEHVDLTAVAGTSVVAFEELAYNTPYTVIYRHEDITDDAQTVTVPAIGTKATNENVLKNLDSDTEQTVVDTIEYKGLLPNTTYTVSSDLIDTATGKSVLAKESTSTFTTGEANNATGTVDGLVNVTISHIDASELEGETLVVYETLTRENVIRAEHKDDEDEDQMVYVPEVHTTALSGDGNKELSLTDIENTVVVDTVEMDSLVPGQKYELTGYLYNKADGSFITDSDGSNVTASVSFTAKSVSETKEITFTFDASGLINTGTSLVAYEYLYEVGVDTKLVGEHEEPDDDDQTVVIPGIGTTLTDADGNREVLAGEDMTLTDTVAYEGLIPGQTYRLTGTLMDKSTGRSLKHADGTDVTAETIFTAEDTEGTVEVIFDLTGINPEGRTLVAFETLIKGETELVNHKDIDDEDQTVTVPKIRTTAVNRNGLKSLLAGAEEVITDTITYDNLLPETEYTVTSDVLAKDTLTSILDGPYETTFTTSETGSGTVDVNITVNASEAAGKALVVYETLIRDNVIRAEHKDDDDTEQMVFVPDVRTTALSEDGQKELTVLNDPSRTVVVDIVEIDNLVIGETYSLSGNLYDKTSGALLTDADGNPVESAKDYTVTLKLHSTDQYGDDTVKNKSIKVKNGTFTITASDMKGAEWAEVIAEITFTFDASKLTDGNRLVAYEHLYEVSAKGDYEVGKHEEPDDEDQTTVVPNIRTKAQDETKRNNVFLAGENTVVIDTVSYKGLIPGTEYKLSATLMNRETGKAVIDADGRAVTAEKIFTAEEETGEADVIFEFNASSLNGVTAVAYEVLSKGDVTPLAEHKDIDDEDQTILFPDISSYASTPKTDKTVTVGGTQKVLDTIYNSTFADGKTYRIAGTMYDAETKEPVKDADGRTITAETTAVADGSDWMVTYEFDTSDYAGRTFVCTTEVYDEYDRLVATEMNFEDDSEYVYFPKVGTTAASVNTDGRLLPQLVGADDYVEFTDHVQYSNLRTADKDGKAITYTLLATLYDAETGNRVTAEGEEVTAIKAFVPKETSGTVDVTFPALDITGLAGHTLVVFEKLYYGNYDTPEDIPDDELVADHEDRDDEDQTLYIPEIGTKIASDKGIQLINAAKDGVLTDTVEYKNLIPGHEYTLTAKLYNRTAGELTGFTATQTFTPEEASGTVDVTFTGLDLTEYGNSKLVAFEYLYVGTDITDSKDQRGRHEDEDDTDQTEFIPEIHTTATGVDGEKVIILESIDDVIKLTDTVEYRNLIISDEENNYEYTLVGTVMYQDTNEPVTDDDGKAVTAKKVFKAAAADGTEEVEFELTADQAAGRTLVVYESLYCNNILIAQHRDINDGGQTVICRTLGVINKIDGSTKEGLEGVLIYVTDVTDGTDLGIFETDADGFVYFPAVQEHTYEFREVEAPEDYVLDEETYSMTILANGTQTGDWQIVNWKLGTAVITKTDSVTGAPLEGALIGVYKNTGRRDSEGNIIYEEVFEQETDRYGRIYFFTEKSGTYVYKEITAPAGYYLETEQYEITINANKTVSGRTSFTNSKIGTIVIKKYGPNGEKLEGAVISIYNKTSGERLGTGKTDKYGRVYFVSPGAGTYYFVEEEAPKGYLRDTGKYTFQIASDGTISGTTSLVDKVNPSPQTGDNMNRSAWLTAAGIGTALTAAGAAVAVRVNRKKRKPD